jgi:hypothetical protein
VWITNVCKVGAASDDAASTSSDAVVDFFVEALKAAMKKPMAYVDVIERACSVNDSVPSEYVGPLLVCVVEKMCRILKSKAKDERYKHDVVSFVHGVVRDTIGMSTVPWMYALLIGHVVEVEFPAAAVADGGADRGRTTTTTTTTTRRRRRRRRRRRQRLRDHEKPLRSPPRSSDRSSWRRLAFPTPRYSTG